jgi:predicted RND superfamily exporter protein
MRFGEAFDYVVHRGGGQGVDGLLLRYFVTGEESSRSLAAIAAIRSEIEALGIEGIPGVAVRIGGGDVVYPLESVYYAEMLARSFACALLGNLVVLWIAWRRPGKALLAVAPVVVAATIVIGAMPIFGVALNALNLGVSAILVGIGIDYPIHWIERYDEERRVRERAPRDAARIALEEMGPHLLAGMLTTAIGFCAATVWLLPMSTSFGLTMGAAIALVYVLTMFALPALVVAWDERRARAVS